MEVKQKLIDIQDILKENAVLVEKALDLYLPKAGTYPESIHKAMRYSVMAGGKRIRPILVIKAAELFGISYEKVLPTACAIEMIHTYSLIHDDLPIMDNDDFRRGKPTCHKVFGDAIALLAGDALLTHAFLTITKNATIEGISEKSVIDVIAKISEAAGSCGMIGGQTVDIEASGKNIDDKTLFYIDLHKTARLLQASIWSGARLAEARDEDLKTLELYGEKIGIIFQITDDILDVIGDEKLIGKPIGSDIKNKKNSFMSIYGLEKSRKVIKKLSGEAKELVMPYENGSGFFTQLVDYLANRNL